MKTTKYFIGIVLLVIFFSEFGIAQKDQVELRLENITNSRNDEICYKAELKSINQQAPKLASQSYRFYYNADGIRFKRETAKSLIVSSAYSDINVLQSIFNTNAQGFGNLDFDSNLGFVNMIISSSGDADKLVSLNNEQWISTTEFCFEKLNDQASIEIIWARDELTKGYATAFTQISLSKAGKTILMDIIYHDIINNKDQEKGKTMVISH